MSLVGQFSSDSTLCVQAHNEVYTVNDDFMQVTQMVSLSGSQISDNNVITEFGDL